MKPSGGIWKSGRGKGRRTPKGRQVEDAAWAQVRAEFSEEQTVQLLMTIATINVWNRMNVTVRNAPPNTSAA